MTDSELSKKYKKLSPIEHVLLKPGVYRRYRFSF